MFLLMATCRKPPYPNEKTENYMSKLGYNQIEFSLLTDNKKVQVHFAQRPTGGRDRQAFCSRNFFRDFNLE